MLIRELRLWLCLELTGLIYRLAPDDDEGIVWKQGVNFTLSHVLAFHDAKRDALQEGRGRLPEPSDGGQQKPARKE